MAENQDNQRKPEKEPASASFEDLMKEAPAPAPEKTEKGKTASSEAPETPEKKAPDPGQPAPEPTGAGTAFSDLAGEEELAVRPGEDWEKEEAPIAPGEADEEAINARILSASASTGNPYWLQALFPGAFALLMLYFFAGAGTGPREILFWIVLFFGGITVIWSAYGMYDEFEPRDKKRCIIGMCMGLASLAGLMILR
jgi:hypothetical protein